MAMLKRALTTMFILINLLSGLNANLLGLF